MKKVKKTGFENVYHGYNDDAPTAFINAVYKDGRFTYFDDPSKTVELKEGAFVRITVPKYSIPKEERPDFHLEKRKVLDKFTRLYFTLPRKNIKFEVILLNDLVLTKDGNKFANANPTSCAVIAMEGKKYNEFDEIEASSLNQAYFKTSLKYKPDALSHTCNIYKQFKIRKNTSIVEQPIDLGNLKEIEFTTLDVFRF